MRLFNYNLTFLFIVVFLFSSSFQKAPPGYVKIPDKDKDPPKYQYGYHVRDGKGGRQGHLESRDGEYALGMYYVNLPGGNKQNVMYFADDWGYHPLVSYSSKSPYSSSNAQFALGERPVAALKQQASTQVVGVTPLVNSAVQPATVLQRVAHVPVVAQPATVVNVQTPVALVPNAAGQATFVRTPGVVVTANGAQTISSGYQQSQPILVGTVSNVPSSVVSSSSQSTQYDATQSAQGSATSSNNVQYVSYVADANRAVPLALKLTSVKQEPASVNEIQKEAEVTVSTTPAPVSYSTIRPIIVTDINEAQGQVEIVTPQPKVYISTPSRLSTAYHSSSASSSIRITTPQPVVSSSSSSAIISSTPSTIVESSNSQQPIAAALTATSEILAPLKAGISLISESEKSTYLNQPIVVPETDQVVTVTSQPQTFVEVQKAVPIEIDENHEYGNSVGRLAVEINRLLTGYKEQNVESVSKSGNSEEVQYNSAQAVLIGNPQHVFISNDHTNEAENEVVNFRGGKHYITTQYPQDQQSEGVEAESEYIFQDNGSQEASDLEYNQQFFESVKQANLGQYLTEGIQKDVTAVHVEQQIPAHQVVAYEKPEHLIHPVPVEKANVVEVPVIQPVHIEHTKVVEVEKPVPFIQQQTQVVEVEKPVTVEKTKLVAVEKHVPVPQPIPVEVTRIVPVDRPIPFAHPVPVPYAVPHPIRVHVPVHIPYAHYVAVPIKEYRPVYTHHKIKVLKPPTLYKAVATNVKNYVHYGARYGDRIPVRTQEVGKLPRYHSTAGRGRALSHNTHNHRHNHVKNLCIEYGFKPPMVPSTPYNSDAEVEAEVNGKE